MPINPVQITYSTLSLHDRRVTKHSHEKILTAFTMFRARQNTGENNGGGVNQDWENWPQKKCAIVLSCSEEVLSIATVSKMAPPQCLFTIVEEKITIFLAKYLGNIQMDFLIEGYFTCRQIKDCKLSQQEIKVLHILNFGIRDGSKSLTYKHFLSFGFKYSVGNRSRELPLHFWPNRVCSEVLKSGE